MKVLLVNKFNFIKGGADKFFLDLANLLESNNIEVAKFCMNHPRNLEDKNSKYFIDEIDFNKKNLKNYFLSFFKVLYNFQAKRNFEKIVLDFRPDIIHLHNIYHQISPSILDISKKYKIPVVMHLHDYKLLCPNYKMYNSLGICEKCKGGHYFNCLRYKCLKKSFLKSFLASLEMFFHHHVLKIYEKNISLYISPSEFTKNKFIEWGINEDKIKVLPNFINQHDFIEPAKNIGNYFLYFGRIVEEKGLENIIEAFAYLKNKKTKIKVVGSGEKEYLDLLKNLVSSRDLSNNFEFIGELKGNELQEIIAESLAVIVPSRWYEVFGLVNLEAGILGRPVIASNIGGIKETIINNKTGLLFNFNNPKDLALKMEFILNNQNETQQLGANAREFVIDSFSSSDYYSKINEVYRGLIK